MANVTYYGSSRAGGGRYGVRQPRQTYSLSRALDPTSYQPTQATSPYLPEPRPLNPNDTSFGGSLNSDVTTPASRGLAAPHPARQMPAPAAPADAQQQQAQAPTSSLEGDPILQRIRALGTMNVNQAIQGGNATRKQLLTQYGDPELAKSQYFDQPFPQGFDFSNPEARLPEPIIGDLLTAEAADKATHPAPGVLGLTTLGQLLYGHEHRQQQLDTGLNANNLFYSSERANELGQEERQYQSERQQAAQTLAGLLGEISQGILQARQGAATDAAGALSGAADRGRQNALDGGAGPVTAAAPAPGGAGGIATALVPPVTGEQNAKPVITGEKSTRGFNEFFGGNSIMISPHDLGTLQQQQQLAQALAQQPPAAPVRRTRAV